MSTPIRFVLNGRSVELREAARHPTLLSWLRAEGHVGTKEGCAEGDCGACTVVIEDCREGGARPRAVTSCILLLPMVQGRRVWTVEGLARGGLHPVQEAMVAELGSQCGYCTPGVVMSLYEAWQRPELAPGETDRNWKIDDQLCGNLCRCTGYRPIRAACEATAGRGEALPAPAPPGQPEEREWALPGLRWLAPRSLAELHALRQACPEARLVAGATDLGLLVTQKGERFPTLLSLEEVAELSPLGNEGEELFIGAGVDLVRLEEWSAQRLPMLHRMLRYFGSRQIKHRATVGGNLCNASPIGDLAPVLLALDAVAHISGPQQGRRLPLSSFFTGYRETALAPDEVLVGLSLRAPPPGSRSAAFKVSRRRELDISAVSAGMCLEMAQGRISAARLAFGGVAATPLRLVELEGWLLGQEWTEQVAVEAGRRAAAMVQPLSDHRGSAEWRRLLVRNLVWGFYEETREEEQQVLQPGHCGTVQLSAGVL